MKINKRMPNKKTKDFFITENKTKTSLHVKIEKKYSHSQNMQHSYFHAQCTCIVSSILTHLVYQIDCKYLRDN